MQSEIQKRVCTAPRAEELRELSFKDALSLFVRRDADKVFIRSMGEGYTWREIELCARVIASELEKIGVKRGTHVGICAENSVNWVFTFFAVQILGAIACLLNPNYTPSELRTVTAVGDITHLCIGNTRSGDCTELVRDPSCPVVQLYDIRPEIDFRKRLPLAPAGELGPRVYADDVCMMIYTSGSTGKPKGVLLSAYNLLLSSALRAQVLQQGADDKLCLILPLFHTFGLSAGFFCNALCGGSVVLPEKINTRSILETIEREKCTMFHSVPTMVLALMNNSDFTREKVASLRCINLGGAGAARAQMLRMTDAFPNVKFLVNYGLSEASLSTMTAYGDTLDHICNTVGKPMENVTVRIADRETGKDCPCGTAGEVMIKGFNLMCSYYKLPAEQQSIDENGWLCTGDMGFLDEAGYLHFCGRYKELIIRGGENIMPGEIAAAIALMEDIQDVRVVGVPDSFYGEVACACVAMKEGCVFDEGKMREFLSDKLSKQKIPAHFMVYDVMPRLANGKPDMVGIRKDAVKAFAASE